MKQIATLLFAITLLPLQSLFAGDEAPGDSSMMDFWVGEWDLTWKDADGTSGKGVNKVYKYLNDRVIFENFEGTLGANKGFLGKSWSVFNKRTGQWKQTWVDNQGAYLDFTGHMEGDNVIFKRSLTLPDGREIYQRMVFRDIHEDHFTWDWENSADGGINWKLNWRIDYRRNNTR